jgi:hypothetical protein
MVFDHQFNSVEVVVDRLLNANNFGQGFGLGSFGFVAPSLQSVGDSFVVVAFVNLFYEMFDGQSLVGRMCFVTAMPT